jgi:phosphoribosylpyrophosphate synthetase
VTLKGIVFDHTTLILSKHRGKVLQSLRDVLGDLKNRGLKIVVFSTDPIDIQQHLRDRSLPEADLHLTRPAIGRAKGSPAWIRAAAERLGIRPFQLLYIGDDELDWRTAINSATFYLHASWARPVPHRATTLVVDSPSSILLYATHFLLLRPRWEYAWSDPWNGLYIRSLLGASARLPATAPASFTLQDVLTYTRKVQVGSRPARDLLMIHALSSAYVEGLIRPNAFFTVYPSSAPGRMSDVLLEFLKPASCFFHGYFKRDLLLRAREAQDTSRARARAAREGQPDPVDFSTQTNTVHVNVKYRRSLEGRSVVVFDDFTTTGMSLEWARNLLHAAGAREIVLLTIGKYPKAYTMYTPRARDLITPFTLGDYTVTRDFVSRTLPIKRDVQAPAILQQSFQYLKDDLPYPAP